MTHEEMYEQFLKYFPSYEPHVRLFVTEDKHSIRILLKNGHVLIFRANDGEKAQLNEFYERRKLRKQKKGG